MSMGGLKEKEREQFLDYQSEGQMCPNTTTFFVNKSRTTPANFLLIIEPSELMPENGFKEVGIESS